jgi:tetratricopeptide (TPR) repeat protein
MSFQGDVAGIGLGELLQGLARGGRDGVLTLHGSDVSGALGLRKGMLYLLAGPDENEDEWRRRSQRAWTDDPRQAMETQRRETISRASRLSDLYSMLVAPNLHFRFEPGPLPTPPGHVTPADNSMRLGEPPSPNHDPVWGPGMSVEFVLLEHARIADEAGDGAAASLGGSDIPRALDPASHPPGERDLLEQCDGRSTIQEIADRLGWPLQQACGQIGHAITSGAVRTAEPREMLAAAQRELEQGRIERAATRLTGWIRDTEPGAPEVGDADLLVSEWELGRLEHVLPSLAASDGRALLRKLDLIHRDPSASLLRWSALLQAHRGDDVTALHEVVLRLVVQEEADARTFQDLLRLARIFQERGQSRRTRTLLRVASSHLPSKVRTRIELGRRMIEAGLVDDGMRWLLDTARELIEAGEGDRALLAIRIVLQEAPEHPQAAGLMIQARALQTRKRRRRWNSMAVLATLLLIAAVALVRFHNKSVEEQHLVEIRDHAANPARAIQLLNEYFPDDESEHIASLRSTLLQNQKEKAKRAREAWFEKYDAVEEECRFGDPFLGLRRALQLPEPPEDGRKNQSWPGVQNLLQVLTDRLSTRAEELDLPPDATLEELHDEERLLSLVVELEGMVNPEASAATKSFHYRIAALRDTIVERKKERAELREHQIASQLIEEQDILLAAARAHATAGDLERSLAAYDRLVALDPELEALLAEETSAVRSHWAAVTDALALAEAGDHAAARARLEEGCETISDHLMPWEFRSVPEGAVVHFPDGSSRVAPFRVRSSFGERMELRIEAEDCLTRTLVVEDPADRLVYLHRRPERNWETEHRVDALPVQAGDDHVVTDRYGRVQRLGRDSRPRWERQLATLGGIARTPVFVPRRSGWLLLLSEDGQAWLLDSATGDIEGPHDLGSPPVEGPTLTRGGVSARFADGRIALWTDRLEPRTFTAEALFPDPDALREPTDERVKKTVALRAGAETETELASPWTDWTVEVGVGEFLVRDPSGRGFTAERFGDWAFVAWEAPKALMTEGRLWVSDDHGLRAYLPDVGPLASYRDE